MTQALDIKEMVNRLAIIESEGVAFYESLAKHTANDKIRKLAKTMAGVEKIHQRRFEELYFSLEKSDEPVRKIDIQAREYIHALIDHRIFDSPAHAAKLAGDMTDENEAVDMAIGFEKENILLLAECAMILTGDKRELVKKFIGQEKAHIISLKKIRNQLAKM